MADDIDAAQAITEIHLAAALRQHQARASAPPGIGVCVTCGDPIAPARLRALPSARQCIECASKRTAA